MLLRNYSAVAVFSRAYRLVQMSSELQGRHIQHVLWTRLCPVLAPSGGTSLRKATYLFDLLRIHFLNICVCFRLCITHLTFIERHNHQKEQFPLHTMKEGLKLYVTTETLSACMSV